MAELLEPRVRQLNRVVKASSDGRRADDRTGRDVGQNARCSSDSTAGDRRVLGRLCWRRPPSVKPPRACCKRVPKRDLDMRETSVIGEPHDRGVVAHVLRLVNEHRGFATGPFKPSHARESMSRPAEPGRDPDPRSPTSREDGMGSPVTRFGTPPGSRNRPWAYERPVQCPAVHVHEDDPVTFHLPAAGLPFNLVGRP